MKKKIIVIAVALIMGAALILTLWNKGVDPRDNAMEMALLQEDQDTAAADTLSFIDPETVVYPVPMAITDTVALVTGIPKGNFLPGTKLAEDKNAKCNTGEETFVAFLSDYVGTPEMMRNRSIPLCENASPSVLKSVTHSAFKTLFLPYDETDSDIKSGFYVPSADEVWYVQSDLTKRPKGNPNMPVTRIAIFQRIDGLWYLAYAPEALDMLFCKSVPEDLQPVYNQELNELVQSPLAICNLRDDTFNYFVKCYNRTPDFRNKYTACYIAHSDNADHYKFQPQQASAENGEVTKSFVRVLEDEVWYIAKKDDGASAGWGQLAIFKRIKGHWYLVANFLSE